MKKILAQIRKLEAQLIDGKLKCDMTKECTQPVTHIDEKGYVYCTQHGLQRKGTMRCRKLSGPELKQLESGKPLARYSSTGPRGGEIIGKTKSGKPIYDSHDHPAHAGFTEDDHADAMNAHGNKLKELATEKRKRSMELAKGSAGDYLKATDNDPKLKELTQKEKHHSNMIDEHSGLFPKGWTSKPQK